MKLNKGVVVKINEIIDILQKMQKDHGDVDLILQKDSEGNGYSPLCGLEAVHYISLNSYTGDVLDEEGYEEVMEERYPGHNAIVLYPIN